MHSLFLIPLIALSAEPKWELAAEETGLKVYSRTKEGTEIREMKAMGIIDATPQEVQAVVNGYADYKTTMPYIEEAKVLAKEDAKTTLFYSRLNTPLVDKRDYIIRCVDESDWKEGKGFLKSTWKVINDKDELVPVKAEVVRVRVNEGYWLMEPRDDGKKTFTTYYVYTSPGGSVPNWIANKGNSLAVPKVFERIRAAVAKNKK